MIGRKYCCMILSFLITIAVFQNMKNEYYFENVVGTLSGTHINTPRISNEITSVSSSVTNKLLTICKELLLKYINVPLSDTLLKLLSAQCVPIENLNDMHSIIFDNQFVERSFKYINCSMMSKLHFLDVPRPLIALISFPGSGNTWTRQIIEYVSGMCHCKCLTMNFSIIDTAFEGRLSNRLYCLFFQLYDCDAHCYLPMFYHNILDLT